MKKFLALNVTLAALFVASSVVSAQEPAVAQVPGTVVADVQTSVSDQIAPPAPAVTSDCVGCAQSTPSFATAAPCSSCGTTVAAPMVANGCSTCAAPAPCSTCAAPVRRLPLRRNAQACSTCCAPAVQQVSYQQPCSTCAQPCSTCASLAAPAQPVVAAQPCNTCVSRW